MRRAAEPDRRDPLLARHFLTYARAGYREGDINALACAIWCLVLLPNAGMIWVGMRYGDQPLVWWVALLFLGVPIAAALISVLLPWRLRAAGLKKAAAYATGALLALAVTGLTGEAWLMRSP